MKITKYIHSCVTIEDGDEKLLIDPGTFTFQDGSIMPEQFKDVSLILITHDHPDHIDVDAVKEITELSDATVITTPQIAQKLIAAGVTSPVLSDIEFGEGSFTIKAIPAAHEAILAPELPENYGFLINGSVLHPGDSFNDELIGHNADVLLLPVTSPWATEIEAFEFAKKVAPKVVIPIHDGFAKEFFQKSRHENFKKNLEPLDIEFRSLVEPGDSTEL